MNKQTFLELIRQRKNKGIDYNKSLCIRNPVTGYYQHSYREWCSVNNPPTDPTLPDTHFMFYRIDGPGRSVQSGDRGISIAYMPIATIPCTNPPNSIDCFDFGTFSDSGYVLQGYTELDDSIALEAIDKLPEISEDSSLILLALATGALLIFSRK
jgi:hypothetical protein